MMTKERELLRRALEAFTYQVAARSGVYELQLKELAHHINAHLAAEEGKEEEEPVAWIAYVKGTNTLGSVSVGSKPPNLWPESTPLYLHPAPSAEKREPLSEKVIATTYREDESMDSYMEKRAFSLGVRFAEKHHGIEQP